MEYTGYQNQAMASNTELYLPHGQGVYADLASKEGENEMLFQDPAQVQQWAATTSATMPLSHEEDLPEELCHDASQWNNFQPQDVTDGVSLHVLDQVPHRTATPGNSSAGTGAVASGLFDNPEPFDALTLDTNGLAYDAWTKIESFEPIQKTPFRSAEASQKVISASNMWMDQSFLPPEDFLSYPGVYPTGQTTWSSPSTASVEPSLASSYSHGLFPEYLSPTCLSGQEDLSSTASLDEPVLSPLALGPAQNLFGADGSQACDATSTLRPCAQFQRSQFPYWSSNENVHSSVVPSPDVFGMYRKPSSDGENTARRNELYQVGPMDDGFYHCPFAKDGCKHKPEKLKCNYDKHLDAHLKPYRCKNPDCIDVPFSSTACLLRHEREAHGMHGHGDKPYLCTYEDCDRAVPGNGFPRRWNLQDHMKRVHDYTGPPTGDKSTGAEVSALRSSRKKRSSTSSSTTKRTKGGNIVKTTSKTSMPSRQRLSIQKNIQDSIAVAQDFIDSPNLRADEFSALLTQSGLSF